MNKRTKILAAAVLGYVGYMAYKKLKATQTVTLPASSSDNIMTTGVPGNQMMMAGADFGAEAVGMACSQYQGPMN